MKIHYVYSDMVKPYIALDVPYIAVSCYDKEGLADGAVGFETSEYTLAIRNALLQRSWSFDADSPFYTLTALASSSVGFCSTSDFQQNARVATRRLGAICQNIDSSDIPESILNNIMEIQASSKSLRSDMGAIKRLCQIHEVSELELQFWPFNTEYESYFLYMGANREVLIANLHSFFDQHGIQLGHESALSFPRY